MSDSVSSIQPMQDPYKAASPTPAEPSEGAAIYHLKDVPDGWDFRRSPDESWQYRDTQYWPDSMEFVEARPKPERPVAVMLPRQSARFYAYGVAAPSGVWANLDESLRDACRKALES